MVAKLVEYRASEKAKPRMIFVPTIIESDNEVSNVQDGFIPTKLYEENIIRPRAKLPVGMHQSVDAGYWNAHHGKNPYRLLHKWKMAMTVIEKPLKVEE
jgi:hypothetical protein